MMVFAGPMFMRSLPTTSLLTNSQAHILRLMLLDVEPAHMLRLKLLDVKHAHMLWLMLLGVRHARTQPAVVLEGLNLTSKFNK